MRFVQEAGTTEHVFTIYGSSQEQKPTTGIADGSVFIETDTHDVYMYDEAAETWRKM